jgi:hypothetical protein
MERVKSKGRNIYLYLFIIIILIGLFVIGLYIAGIVIFLDFYGFIPKSGEIYSISIGIQSYGGLAENITLILPAVICDGEVLQLSNAEIVEINGKPYYKIQIENLSYKYDHFSFECLNKKKLKNKNVNVSSSNIYVYFENAEKLRVDYAVYVAEVGREGYLINLLSFTINKNDSGKWISV